MRASRTVGLLLAATFSCALVVAQATVEGKRLSTPPTIDGKVEADEWAGASAFSGSLDGETGSPAPETGEYWLGYDKDFIYFAARLADSQPSDIIATEYRTNVSLEGNDHLHLYFDLAGTLNSFNEFWMNPNGATNIQLSGGRALKREWLGEFQAKGRITDKGWEVEARIPWQLMQLPAPGPKNMRIQIARYMARTQRTYGWVYTAHQPQRMGTWLNVEVPKPAFRRTLKLLPYTYLGRDEDGEGIFNSGLDLKTSLTPTVELVGTINPDFRNVENNILSLDFSYFERLPNDVRPFFAEGGDYYGNALFNSLRIGSFDAGLNTYGQLSDRLSFGALATTRIGDETDFTGAFNYRQNSSSYWRGAATSLRRDDGTENDAYLLRFQKEYGGFTTNVRGQWSQDRQVGNGSNWDIFTQYSKGEHYFDLGYNEVTPNFLPRLGFIPFVDNKGWFADYIWSKPYPKGDLMETGFQASWFDLDFYHGGDFYRGVQAGPSFTLRDGLNLNVLYNQESILGNEDRTWSAYLQKPRGDRYRHWSVGIRDGEIADHAYRRISGGFQYRPVNLLQLDYQFVRLEHFENATQHILTAVWDLGKDQSLNARIVGTDDDRSGYIAYRRSGNRGNEYFLIFGDPNSRTFRSSIIFKAVMPFEIG